MKHWLVNQPGEEKGDAGEEKGDEGEEKGDEAQKGNKCSGIRQNSFRRNVRKVPTKKFDWVFWGA